MLSAVCRLPSAICHLPSAICHLPSAICHLLSAASSASTSGMPSTPCCLLATANPSANPAKNERPASAAQAAAMIQRVSQGSVNAGGGEKDGEGRERDEDCCPPRRPDAVCAASEAVGHPHRQDAGDHPRQAQRQLGHTEDPQATGKEIQHQRGFVDPGGQQQRDRGRWRSAAPNSRKAPRPGAAGSRRARGWRAQRQPGAITDNGYQVLGIGSRPPIPNT